MSTSIKLVGEWDEAGFILANLDRISNENLQYALRANAKVLRKTMRKTITWGDPSWPALSRVTTNRKGSNRKLIDTRQFRDSITTIRINKTALFVGVPPGKKNREGKSLEMIALVHEEGVIILPKSGAKLIIPLNDEAESLYHKHGTTRSIPGLFKPKGKNYLAVVRNGIMTPMYLFKDIVKVPPRPWRAPSIRRSRAEIKKNWERAVKRAIKGKPYRA